MIFVFRRFSLNRFIRTRHVKSFSDQTFTNNIYVVLPILNFSNSRFYKLVLLNAAKHKPKKTTPKPDNTARDNHGNGWPRADARRHRLAGVRGDRESTIRIASGT